MCGHNFHLISLPIHMRTLHFYINPRFKPSSAVANFLSSLKQQFARQWLLSKFFYSVSTALSVFLNPNITLAKSHLSIPTATTWACFCIDRVALNYAQEKPQSKSLSVRIDMSMHGLCSWNMPIDSMRHWYLCNNTCSYGTNNMSARIWHRT